MTGYVGSEHSGRRVGHRLFFISLVLTFYDLDISIGARCVRVTGPPSLNSLVFVLSVQNGTEEMHPLMFYGTSKSPVAANEVSTNRILSWV